jgi:L-serine dehydratase
MLNSIFIKRQIVFKEYILEVLDTMYASIKRGLSTTGVIPGKLKLQRVAKAMNDNIFDSNQPSERWLIAVSSYAYAVAEENACGNVIVTAPTCGASGVLPAVLYYCYNDLGVKKNQLVEALCVAGIIGNVVKNNATISGAEGGCQAEIGVACSMAAGAYAYINSLSNKQICYASEMGLEHNLGLTCDPIGGYVQIPCIERNGFAALRAIDCANYAKQLGPLRENKISFDTIVKVMKETGKDLGSAYKETSLGGLAREYKLDED